MAVIAHQLGIAGDVKCYNDQADRLICIERGKRIAARTQSKKEEGTVAPRVGRVD